PHAAIDECTTADIPRDAVVVTYCWGPHCNGATKAAARFAALGFRVKEMLGGITGWQTEGYELDGPG
ncbi:MAG TPA: rhodanese-like domain-containing protein, partial [Acidimicrobiia bacterium]|nr:rhodanese-like domain-containing protein [Acidimicrobiia bacterium]